MKRQVSQVRLGSAAVTAQAPPCFPHAWSTLRDSSLCWALLHLDFAPRLRRLNSLGVEQMDSLTAEGSDT